MFIELVHDMTDIDFLKSLYRFFFKIKLFFENLTYFFLYWFFLTSIEQGDSGWESKRQTAWKMEKSKKGTNGDQHGLVLPKLIIFSWMQGPLNKK